MEGPGHLQRPLLACPVQLASRVLPLLAWDESCNSGFRGVPGQFPNIRQYRVCYFGHFGGPNEL